MKLLRRANLKVDLLFSKEKHCKIVANHDKSSSIFLKIIVE